MRKRGRAATRIERFIRRNKIKPAELAREAGVTRQQLLRIRKGTADPRFMTALRIRDACSRLLLRYVAIEEVFGRSRRAR